MTRLSVLFTAAVFFAAVPVLAVPADSIATEEDIKVAYEKADYAETLKLVGRLLALKGKSAEGIDRYPLLMYRAESHLKLRATGLALEALEEAAKVATAADDGKRAAEARALTVLVKKSKSLQFTPKVAVGTKKALAPIDITDSKKRPEAFEALYSEEKAAAKPLVAQADKGKSLVPVDKAMKAVLALKDLEIAATGNSGETAETVMDLVDRAHKLMAKGLDDMSRKTERIAERADQVEQVARTRLDGGTDYVTRRRGLMKEETAELKQNVNECKRIVQYCKALTANFTDTAEPFEDLEDQAIDLGERAYEILKENYSLVK